MDTDNNRELLELRKDVKTTMDAWMLMCDDLHGLADEYNVPKRIDGEKLSAMERITILIRGQCSKMEE